MKVVSLVVEGLEQAQQGGLFEWLHEVDADVICLQDTRCSEYSLKDDVFFPEAYNAYFLDDFENPTQNGVAIYCKQLPKAMMSGLGFADFDGKGLYLQADYNNVSIGSLLMPSGRDGEAAMNSKFKFMELLSQHLQKVRNKRRGFIICGGWELLANSIDAEEAGNRVDIPGFSDIEQGWLQSVLPTATATRSGPSILNPTPLPGGPMAMMPADFELIRRSFPYPWTVALTAQRSMTPKRFRTMLRSLLTTTWTFNPTAPRAASL